MTIDRTVLRAHVQTLSADFDLLLLPAGLRLWPGKAVRIGVRIVSTHNGLTAKRFRCLRRNVAGISGRPANQPGKRKGDLRRRSILRIARRMAGYRSQRNDY